VHAPRFPGGGGATQFPGGQWWKSWPLGQRQAPQKIWGFSPGLRTLSNSQVFRIPRIGFGWDSHEFKPGIPLKIGGVLLPHHSGLAGHSDGDVLLHALTDALLGAIAAGDIGTYFPPTDPKWKGADSAMFVREALRLVDEAGYAVGNVDSTLILAAPKISPHAIAIQQKVADLLGIEPSRVGIKAKTPEGMGTDNAAIAHVAVLLAEISWP
jgi:2-C-methyl-D-erythritol 2,4-cyclodiphosphate synthase